MIAKMLSKVSLSNTPGQCRDVGALQSASQSGLQDFPTGHWTKQMKDFPANFSSEKIVAHHSDAKKHWIAGYRMCKSEKVAQALLSYAVAGFIFCRAKVQASFSVTKNYTVQIKLERLTGKVIAAYCACAAGRGGVCKHVGALLFHLLDVHLAGYSFIPDTIACTEKKRKWGVTAEKTKAQTTKFSELFFVKHEPGKVTNQRKVVTPAAEITTDILKNLQSSMFTSSKNSMFCRVLQDERFVPLQQPQPVSALPSTVPSSTRSRPLIPTEILWYEEVQEIRQTDYNQLSCDLTLEEAHALELQTREQSKTNLWHEERAKRITASKFKDVVSRKIETTEDFIKKIFTKSYIQTKHMKMGLDNEEIVINKYLTEKKGTVEIFKCGFLVNPGVPFVGASPDGLVYDDKRKSFGLIEIKTLAKAMEMGLDICQAVESKKAPFLTSSLTLKKTHRYYLQVQGQLAVSGLAWCDFVVDSGKEIHIEEISFDSEMWVSAILPKLVNFYAVSRMNTENI